MAIGIPQDIERSQGGGIRSLRIFRTAISGADNKHGVQFLKEKIERH